LFSDEAVNDDCLRVLGFTGEQAVNVMEELRRQSGAGLQKRFDRMAVARNATVPFLTSRRGRSGPSASGPQPSEADRAVMTAMLDAVRELTTNVDKAAVIDSGVIAERTGYTPATVEAVLDAYTISGLGDLDETLDRFFRGDNPLRTAPIVIDEHGRRMLVHDGLALPAVREVIEAGLKAAGHQKPYEAHRGTWVEDTAVGLLATVFPGAEVFRGFKYFVPDPYASVEQTEPEKFTKLVEGDGLILVDDVAIIIEVKSVALTAEARCGVDRTLQGKLRDIITHAASQAVRVRERMLTDQRIRLKGGEWIDVAHIREIHTIAVGLEDLSGVTTATTALLAAGVLAPNHIPWTVSVHDLRIVCELLERPAELLLYLRRRTEPAATWRYRAVDELDLFMHFLQQGLYVEPDPRATTQALPWSAPPTDEDIHRFQQQQPELIGSRTEQIDAWYEAQLGTKSKPVSKPKLIADRRLLNLIDVIASSQARGSLATAASLLEGNGEVQQTFGRYATDLAKLVRRDNQHHSITHLLGDTGGRHVLLVWVCHAPNEDAEIATSYLQPYLRTKKHQTGAYRATCLLFDPTGKRLLRLLYDNQPVGPDPVLDEAAARLVPLQQMNRATPRPIRPTDKH
jgi:hypothetical protein